MHNALTGNESVADVPCNNPIYNAVTTLTLALTCIWNYKAAICTNTWQLWEGNELVACPMQNELQEVCWYIAYFKYIFWFSLNFVQRSFMKIHTCHALAVIMWLPIKETYLLIQGSGEASKVCTSLAAGTLVLSIFFSMLFQVKLFFAVCS